MKRFALSAWLMLPVSAYAQPLDPCLPPLGTVAYCPQKYLPRPVVASTKDFLDKKATIQKSIDDFKDIVADTVGFEAKADDALKIAKDIWDKKRADADIAETEDEKKAARMGINQAFGAYLQAKKRYDQVLEKKAELAAKVIQDTSDLYQLEPPVTDFSKDASLDSRWRSAQPWKPVFSEMEIQDPDTGEFRKRNSKERIEEELEKKANARQNGLPVPQGVAMARTWSDGRIGLFGDAFTDPENVALMIHHETSHWIDVMRRGGSASSQPEEHYRSEQAGYARQAELADKMGRTMDANWARGISAQYYKQAEAIKGMGLTWPMVRANLKYANFLDATMPASLDSSLPLPGDLGGRRRSADDEFLDSVRRGAERSRPAMDEARRLAREAEARRQAEAREQAERVAEAGRLQRWGKFKLWTIYAHQYIAGVRYGDPEWGDRRRIEARDAALRNYLETHMVVLTGEEIDAGMRRDADDFSGESGRRHRLVVQMIRDIPGPVDLDWLMARIEYAKRGGREDEAISSFLAAIGRAVSDGTEAIVKTVTAPFESERGAGGGGGREGSADDGSSGRGDTQAYRQLRGVAGKGW